MRRQCQLLGLSRSTLYYEAAAETHFGRLAASGRRPVIVCSSRVRRHIRRLAEQAFPQLAVVSHNEIVPGVRVESAGLVSA